MEVLRDKMVTLTVVCKLKNGFGIVDLKVKAIDMTYIAKEFPRQVSGWGFDPDNCEIFYRNKNGWSRVALIKGGKWAEIYTWVKNWDKYASPSWVKRVKATMKM